MNEICDYEDRQPFDLGKAFEMVLDRAIDTSMLAGQRADTANAEELKAQITALTNERDSFRQRWSEAADLAYADLAYAVEFVLLKSTPQSRQRLRDAFDRYVKPERKR